MNKFLLVRLSSLGDIIHTLPAYSALRSAFADARITWVVEDKGREILELVPGLDRIVVISAKKWKWHSRALRSEIRRVVSEIRDKDQVAIDFQGLIKSGLLTWLSQAKQRVGFARSDLREPLAGWFYTSRSRPYSDQGHVIFKNLNLLESLGIRQQEPAFPLALPDNLRERVQDRLNDLGFDGGSRLVVLNVGAAWETKRWSAAKWSALIQDLPRKDVFPLLLWGSEQENSLAQEISKATGALAAPFLTLKEVIALLDAAELVVSGDTFALQAACALGRPAVAIFGPTTPERNGPFREEDKTAFHPLPCSHCYKRSCPDIKCLEAVQPEEVAALCRERLEQS
jgi:heptosyltransferase-1